MNKQLVEKYEVGGETEIYYFPQVAYKNNYYPLSFVNINAVNELELIPRLSIVAYTKDSVLNTYMVLTEYNYKYVMIHAGSIMAIEEDIRGVFYG